jgi:hypothetical protein
VGSCESEQHAGKLKHTLTFLERFGCLFDDLVGCNETLQLSRVRLSVLSVYLWSFLQRCTTAAAFGAFHMQTISALQLGMLVTLHASYVTYLVVVQPYTAQLMLISDLLAYGCELAILVGAVVLLQQPQSQALHTMFVVCYFAALLLMVIPDGFILLWRCWQWTSRRLALRRHARAKATHVPDILQDDAMPKSIVAANAGDGDGTLASASHSASAAATAALKLTASNN